MTHPIRVLLADDHPMFVEGVKNALRKYEDLRVVGECFDGAAVLETLRQHPVDVAVLDINMPGMGGVETARQIAAAFPATRVVFLTMYHPNDLDGSRPEALGYVLKHSGSETLHRAITAAAAGTPFLDPRLSALMGDDAAEQAPGAVKLSSREKEIIRNIVLGKTNKEIADALFVSELTVKTHRRNIYRKLDISNTSTLILTVQKMRLLND